VVDVSQGFTGNVFMEVVNIHLYYTVYDLYKRNTNYVRMSFFTDKLFKNTGTYDEGVL